MFRSNSRMKFAPLRAFGYSARKQQTLKTVFLDILSIKHSPYLNGLREMTVSPISFSHATNILNGYHNIEEISRRCLKGVNYYATKRLK